MQHQPTLSTDRLTLRPFTPEDAWDVERLAGAREIADTTLNIPHPYPVGAASRWIETHRKAREEGTSVTFAIVVTGTMMLGGAISLMAINKAHKRGEIGYWIAKDKWNNGFATEAGLRLLAFGFDDLKLHRVEGRYLLRNPASARVLQKLGMQKEGIQRDWAIKWDRYETLEVCAILEPEWRALQANHEHYISTR